MSEEAFTDYGWRIPFLLSIVLLAVSLWILSETKDRNLSDLG